jgi:uncharacterized membrane protein (DUF106 family)
MYRDDYAALQARADAVQKHLEELRESTSGDKEKIATLARELAETSKQLRAAQQQLGLIPKSNAPVVIVVLLLVLLFVALFGYFNLFSRKVAAKEAMLDAQMQMLQEHNQVLQQQNQMLQKQ